MQLSAQFSLDELKSIRKDQIKAVYCDSMLLNRAQRIEQQDKVIRAQNEALFRFREKEEIHLEQKVYYREQLRVRDNSIYSLERKNKTLKIGCLVLGSTTAILTGLVLLKK